MSVVNADKYKLEFAEIARNCVYEKSDYHPAI
jgi:hypothetical protein